MNFDELKNNWEKEMHTPALDTDDSIKTAQKTDGELKRAFYIEMFACVALFSAGALALIFQVPMNALMLLSCAIFMGMSLYIPYRLIQARKANQQNDWTLRNNIEREIDKLEKQSKLLSSVASWYVAPLAIAIFCGSWGGYALRTGTYVPDIPLIIYWAFAGAMGIGIIFWNKIAARKKIQPTLNKLLNLKRQLEE